MVNLIDNKSQKDNTTTPNPILAMLFFFVVTSIYCIISIFITDSTQRLISKVCYILFVICGEYFINLNLSESMCGIRQWKTTFFITIVPWLLIFIIMQLFISMFPGWMSPFSNTFGYLVAKLMGLPDLMEKILVVDNKTPEAIRALESVRSDNSLLINELYPEEGRPANGNSGPIVREKFDKAWDKLKNGQIIQTFDQDKDKETSLKEKLYHFVQMKYSIAEYIWNLLTGFLVTSISYNYIINTGCAKSPKEMKKRYDQYEEDQTKKQQAQKQQESKQPTYKQS